MSAPNQDIKAVFDQAFAAEQIPFDMGAWNQMNALLNQRARRRAIWIWFSGLALFLALTSGYTLSMSTNMMYHPRTQAEPFQPALASTICAEDLNALSTSIIETRNSVSKTPTSKESATLADHKANSTYLPKPHSENNGSLADGSNYTPSKPALPIEKTEPKSNNTAAPNATATLDSSATTPVETHRSMDWIDLMSILTLDPYSNDTTALPANKPSSNKTPRLYNFYVRAGVSKSIFHNPIWSHPELGQEVGGGVQYFLKEHLLLSGELGFARVRMEDTTHITGIKTYGYTANQNSYLVNTSELYYLELPLMAHYRMNRLMIGGGFSGSYLLGLKNETTHQVSSDRTSVTQTNQGGFYQWDRYRSYQFSALLDAQYQLASGSFIGARLNSGLFNVLAIEQKKIGMSRVDIYLKINLK